MITRSQRFNDIRRNETFLAMLPTISSCATRAFCHLHGDDRDDAIQEVVANAFTAFVRLARRGRLDRGLAAPLARFAVAQVRQGRKVGSPLNGHDALSRYAQIKHRFFTNPLSELSEDQWSDVITGDSRPPVADRVSFKIDFLAWLRGLSSRERQVAGLLAVGNTTRETAREACISPGRVSQLRHELCGSWHRFYGYT